MTEFQDFVKIVRICVRELERTDEYGAREALEPMRKALAARKLYPKCHEGRNDLNPEETVEWYAGQGLYMVDVQAWHCINSYINLLDRFVPE